MVLPLMLMLLCSPFLHAYSPTLPLSIDFASTTQPRPVAALRMEEAVGLAKKHRPDLQAFELRVQEARFKVKEAWGGYLPQVSLQTTFKQERHENALYGNSRLCARQLVYRAGGPQTEAARARRGVEIAEHEKEAQELKIQYEVEYNFINAWLLQQQRRLMRQVDKASEAVFRKAAHEEELKLLDKVDWLKRGEERAAAQLRVLSFRDDLSLAQRNLDFLLGQAVTIDLLSPDGTQLSFEPPTDGELAALDSYEQAALQGRPELKRERALIGFEQENEKIFRQAYLPEASIFGTAARNSINVVTAPPERPGDHGYFDFGAQFSWNIFDGATSHHRAAQAHARKVAASLQLEQASRDIKFQVQSAYYETSKALLALKAQRYAYQRARTEFARKKQEFSLGLLASQELEAARNDWYSAKYAWLTLTGQLAQKQAELRYACGYTA